MKIRSQSAFTLIEMLVVISIIAVLAAFAVPALTSALTKGQMTGTLNNGRQLYLAGQQMALDGAANSDPNLTWPGDDTNAALDLQGYASKLTQNDYLKIGDVAKLFSAPGATCTAASDGNTPPGVVLGGTAAFKVYKVKDSDSANTILLVTKNYTYDTAFAANPASPFGDKGFIVQRRGGDASILRKNNAVVAAGQDAVFQSTVGKKPGDPDGGPVTAGDPAGFMHFP